MHVVAILAGMFCCLGVALDAFQTIILPRRPAGRLRITRLFYIATWSPWVAVAERVKNHKVRDQIYSIYGPLSLLLLLVVWALLLVTGFALIYFGLGTPFSDPLNRHLFWWSNICSDFYVSGSALLELGLSDSLPADHVARTLVVVESGTGLGLVALVIGYVPVLYQAFSRREVSVAMLDGRAGSPPTATELLRRHAHEGGELELIALLAEWERWSAEILESHISYPLLCYYRSQHDNQSWLSALVSVLDACALLITTVEGPQVRQAQLTFAMARHALIDLGHVFRVEEKTKEKEQKGLDRLPAGTFGNLCENLDGLHLKLCGDKGSMKRLTAIRMLYEPHAHSLSDYLKLALPLWVAEPKKTDAWKTVAELKRGARADADAELALRASEHVSESSTSTHLHDEEHGF
jgi:hypothetical protein